MVSRSGSGDRILVLAGQTLSRFIPISKRIQTESQRPSCSLWRMTRVQTRPSGMGSSRRLARDRENGMRSVGRITRLALAASVALAAVFSALADVAFPGRSVQTAGQGARAAVGGDSTVRVALPPRNGGDSLTPPITAPMPAVGSGSVATSGGS
jgi:hypothetical protein